jgi:hypothetical protein
MSAPTLTSAPGVSMIEITHIVKEGGPLTKRISLAPDGTLLSDGSACIMAKGTAKRANCTTLEAFAASISKCRNHEAIALGALRAGLPDEVDVVTKAGLEKLNGSADSATIARTSEYIQHRSGQPGMVLIDVDTKGMPDTVRTKIDAAGGYWNALVSVVPELEKAARVVRSSTSTGIRNSETGENLPGSSGQHIFILVKDGGDTERLLRTLHDRCWLTGFGWFMVGAGGQLLERSIVDRTVYASERLVFEGAPVLDPPLLQDLASRQPVVHDGAPLDTVAACPPLRVLEKAQLEQLRSREANRIAPARALAREKFVEEQADHIVKRTGCTVNVARRTVEQQCDGTLLSDVVLPFDDADLADTTVGDVLADPAKFAGATLADPLEGVPYGRCKAKILRRASGTPWINSFAHGRTVYELKHSAGSIKAILNTTKEDQLVSEFVRLAVDGDLEPDEQQILRDDVSDRTQVNKRTIDQSIKDARKQQARQLHQENAERRAAERRDPRPQIPAPMKDAPWLPEMEVMTDVLGTSKADEPPMRDDTGFVTEVALRGAAGMHTLTALGSNGEDADDMRLPAPEHPLLSRLGSIQLSEVIERHIDYVDERGRSVHVDDAFVRHFLQRKDTGEVNALPIVRAVATMPMVLQNGKILSGHGLNREIGVVFRVPEALQALIPPIEDCTDAAVARAMHFLTNVWLCDVACNYAGKCVLIAIVCSVLERLLLPERPAFSLNAGQRGSGKTTAANMISTAALGTRAAAAAWSPNEEERRKAYLAYAIEGLAMICWDNLVRGQSISCPTLEKALTAETYTDRVLGSSEFKTVLANAIHVFTGNNIQAIGDLASRTLEARFEVNRPDPENRKFKHPDPIGWTEANRGKILQAIYTVMLGNPRLRPGNNQLPAETRFKGWWHLVGSAIENGATQHMRWQETEVEDLERVFPPERNEQWLKCRAEWNEACEPEAISFQNMFAAGELSEEQSSSIHDVMKALRARWSKPEGFKGDEVATWINTYTEESVAFRVALEAASGGKPMKEVTQRTVTWRLKAVCGSPVVLEDTTIALKYVADHYGGTFVVRSIR